MMRLFPTAKVSLFAMGDIVMLNHYQLSMPIDDLLAQGKSDIAKDIYWSIFDTTEGVQS